MTEYGADTIAGLHLVCIKTPFLILLISDKRNRRQTMAEDDLGTVYHSV